MDKAKDSLARILISDGESNLLPRKAITSIVDRFYSSIGQERFERFVDAYQRSRTVINRFISCLVSVGSIGTITDILSGKDDSAEESFQKVVYDSLLKAETFLSAKNYDIKEVNKIIPSQNDLSSAS